MALAPIKNKKMKKAIGLIITVLAIVGASVYFLREEPKEKQATSNYTNVCIKNSSDEDSVLVYVTLQAPNSVVGVFGIQAGDTIGSCSKGTFYAYRDSSYTTNLNGPLCGAVVSFVGDNVPCGVAISQGFKWGINIFEFSINVPYEVFDISCEDGINCIIKSKVSDSLWTTGDGVNEAKFDSTQNRIEVGSNVGIRGVFPYRCTDCIDLGKAIPENCFNLRDTCSQVRTCQVARTMHNGGVVMVIYKGSFQVCK